MDGYIRNTVFPRNFRGGTAFALCASGCGHALGAPEGLVGQAGRRARRARRAGKKAAVKGAA